MNALLLAGVLSVLVAPASQTQAAASTLQQANAALQAGEADLALSLLDAQPASAEGHNLRCRVDYALEQWDAAAAECEQAVRMDSSNALYHLWLGRAFGEKADRASFLSAYSLGKRVRDEFEAAARLNPQSPEALSDLGEFYYDAPSIVGGGDQKAYKVADDLARIAPARAHELRGRIAESRKDFSTAEDEFKKAIALDPHPAFQWTVIASFYRRRSRWSDMDAALNNVVRLAQHDAHAGVALYDGASTLIAARRNPSLAAHMLQLYLAMPIKSEEAPAFAAWLRLARLQAQLGDLAAARASRAQALSFAHTYKPALDASF
jgi:tetratricopeptide (TPR) repeat protein